jgi:hypothetical protein
MIINGTSNNILKKVQSFSEFPSEFPERQKTPKLQDLIEKPFIEESPYYTKIKLPNLKQLIKNIGITSSGIKNVIGTSLSSSNKKELIKIVQMHKAAKKIQNFLRQKWMKDDTCPLSLEPVKYPVFAFKPKDTYGFIYYNLEMLGNYIVSTGTFQDPKTREPYTQGVLKSIDKTLKSNGITLEGPFDSVYKASKNVRYYRQKKDLENTILILERCLDEINSSIILFIEQRVGNPNLLFMAFRSYFKKLCVVSKTEAKNLINRTILSVNNSVKNNQQPSVLLNRDTVVLFLYQLLWDELEA